jgi:hypothetical protein
MKARWSFFLCLIGIFFSLTACNRGADPVPATPPSSTENPQPSRAVSLFTLLSADNYDYQSASSSDEPLPPGTLPALDTLPPIDTTLLGKEMTVNLGLESHPIYFYYCKTEQTERLVMIVSDGISGEVAYPLLIVADVSFNGWDALNRALTSNQDFGITILSVANISWQEGNVYIRNTVEATALPSESIAGVMEYYGRAGGGAEVLSFPRSEANAFHRLFDRFSLNAQIGVWIDPSED